MTRSVAAAALTIWSLLRAEASLAQNPQALFPPNVILPNNNSLPIGEVGGLEANAYTARASDPTSLWFNPAGIAGANVSAVSASTGTFRILTVSPQIGSSEQRLVADLAGSELTRTEVKISNIGIIDSVSYVF